MKSNKNGIVEEVNRLMNYLDISGEDAIEIINIYFECYSDTWNYSDFLKDEIRVIRQTLENEALIAELQTIEDVCIFEGDNYILLTNYQTLQNMGEIGDCISNNS